MTEKEVYSTPWFVFLKRNPQAVMRLFCFHYGGGSASVFRSWVSLLPDTIELVAIQLPGREGRFGETFLSEHKTLTSALTDASISFLDKPYAVFGHSLGAINGFEWVRETKKRNLRQPDIYISAGMPAPEFPDQELPISSLPEEEFVCELIKNYGESLAPVLRNKDLRKIFIPQLRADFCLLENYRYCEGLQMDCPIIALAGEEEVNISEKELSAWAGHTSSRFKAVRFPGGHFFVQSSEAKVLNVINQELKEIIRKHNKETNQTC